MSGLIGKKIGMTSIFDETGKNIPCTILELGPCIVTQIKSNEKDGYKSFQNRPINFTFPISIFRSYIN